MMLLERLRNETRTHHQRLEQVVGLPASLDEHVTRLELFHAFLAPWEAAAQRVPGVRPEWFAGRLKAGWLAEDLGHFGRDAQALAKLPRCAELSPLTSSAAVLGTLYVFEGSTLGGQVLARHVERTFGLRGGAGYRYFLSYGAEVGARWQAFRALLVAEEGSPGRENAIVEGAHATFDRLHDWFAGAVVGR